MILGTCTPIVVTPSYEAVIYGELRRFVPGNGYERWGCSLCDRWNQGQILSFKEIQSLAYRQTPILGAPIATADLRLHPAITAIELCKGWTPRLVSDMRWPNWSNVTQAPLSQLSTIPILVGGLEHVLFFHILGITIPTDSYFSDGLKPPTSITS